MRNIEEILDRSDGRSIGSIIDELKEKSTTPPAWSELRRNLVPRYHDIVEDKQMRRDKVTQENYIEKAARLTIGLEMLLAKRVNQFTFTIPVKRVYGNIEENESRQEIAKAIEMIYQEADIDTVNIERGFAYYASCEILTIWYVVEKPNTIYGFPSQYKLRCRTFSPMDDDVQLYPLLDEYGDMICMSVSYTRKIQNERVEFFETWTSDKHYKLRQAEKSDWVDEIVYEDGDGNRTYGDTIEIMKIPCIYAWRKNPIYEQGTPELRQDAEYKHSEDSDIISYNAAPLIKAVGRIIGDEKKYESRRLIRVEQGGDVGYVTWNQGTEAAATHIQRDIDWFWMLNQMPDTSFKNLQSLGNIGYDARQMMLTDAFLRIGEESRPLLQFFRRECNVIKAFLKKMNTRWSEEDIDAVSVSHEITAYIPKDEKYEIEKRMTANGGKPIESQRESISRWGKSQDVDATIEEINNEAQADQSVKMAGLLEGAY